MQYLDFEIDKLTNSIVRVVSGEVFETEVLLIHKADLQTTTQKNGWKFNWKKEFIPTKNVYKLVTTKEPLTIQGLISFTIMPDHIYMDLIEVAPFNYGKNKQYTGVAGNLVAFACMQSFIRGFDGYVAFDAKTQLISHYESTLGAVRLGSQRMAIETRAAASLVHQYFSNFTIKSL
jgi:hypothetical protein